MKYRAEIDGLRALAVVPVILFHAGFEIFGGGFVGVDVFFVISGYLITTIILKELEDGKFSIVNFYERRARRILPALFFVALVCIPFAWLWLSPSHMKDFAQSLVAVTTFSSNILFWQQSGYFDTAAELKPLLHTWSLAVEEQYYILFPLFLMATWKLGKKAIITMLAILFVISLALAQWAAVKQPNAAFFLLPTRGWEILLGAFCAFYLAKNSTDKAGALNNLLSIAGLGLIALAVLTFDATTPIPGLYALIPTVGVALIILFGNRTTIAGKFLSNRLLVRIGLISYSAYLWHQPLFAFALQRSLVEPSEHLMLALSFGALVLAYFSWLLVELPFRNRSLLTRKKIFANAAFFSTLIISLGLVVSLNLVAKKRPSLDWLEGKLPKRFTGIMLEGENCSARDPSSPCRIGEPNAKKTLVIAGDSHARVLIEAVYMHTSKYNYEMIDLSASACPFLLELNLYANGKLHKKCNVDYQQARLDFLKNLPPSIIILHSRFPLYIAGHGFNNTIGGVELGRNFYVAREQEQDLNVRYIQYKTSFDKTLREILALGHEVIIVAGVPATGWNVINRLYRIETLGIGSTHEKRKKIMDIPLSAITAWHKMSDDAIAELLKKYPQVKFLDPKDIFCNNKVCSSITKNQILFTDRDHLSITGTKILLNKILEALSIKNSNDSEDEA